MSIEQHRRYAAEVPVSVCVVVTSDKILRGIYSDEVTALVARLVAKYGCELKSHALVPNSRDAIALAISESLRKCDVVVVTGGTGLGPRDLSVDVVREICSKDIPGFGELFRYITFQMHGAVALASRATACAVGDRLVFVTPGSPDAVELALDRLVLPEIKHLIAELRGLRL
ncbi:MAG: molybdopterin-binding protein [Sulfolobales archaeon]